MAAESPLWFNISGEETEKKTFRTVVNGGFYLKGEWAKPNPNPPALTLRLAPTVPLTLTQLNKLEKNNDAS